MKKLMALTTALFLVTQLLWGSVARAYDQPRPPIIQLLQGQESLMQPQLGEQDQPQGEEEQPQQEQPAPEQPPQDAQQQEEQG